MVFKTVYIPNGYTFRNADAYIRSAFTIPKKAIATDITMSTGVLIIRYTKDDTALAQFTVYPLTSHKGF